MTQWRMILLGTIGLIAGLIAFLPLRLVLPAGALSARDVTGTIWSGWLLGARAGPVDLGDLHVGLVWPGEIRVSPPGTAPDKLRVHLAPGSNALSISKANGRMPVNLAWGPLAVRDLELRNAALDWGAQGCQSAKGRVVAQAGIDLPVAIPPLSLGGTLECRGKDLAATLKSATGLEQLDLSLFPGGQWQARATIRPASRETAAALLAAGFQETALGYVRTEQGGTSQ